MHETDTKPSTAADAAEQPTAATDPVAGGSPADPATADDTTNGPSAGDAPAADPTAELFQQLASLQGELAAARERHIRSVADLDNFRKRALRDKEDARRAATTALIEDILPVIDNFAMGLEAARQHEGGEAFVSGFSMVLSQLKSVLAGVGVEELNPLGFAFDPNLHEAIAHQAHDTIAEGLVCVVHRTGYRLGERLIRPASVVVSNGQPPPAAE
jgi:molecular chaperone GrpE